MPIRAPILSANVSRLGVLTVRHLLTVGLLGCSRKLTAEEPGDAEAIRLYYVTGGNGKEIRTLSRFL